jgi:hypothetical protein
VWGVGCGVWGVGCGVWGVGCGVWGVGCGVWGVGDWGGGCGGRLASRLACELRLAAPAVQEHGQTCGLCKSKLGLKANYLGLLGAKLCNSQGEQCQQGSPNTRRIQTPTYNCQLVHGDTCKCMKSNATSGAIMMCPHVHPRVRSQSRPHSPMATTSFSAAPSTANWGASQHT